MTLWRKHEREPQQQLRLPRTASVVSNHDEVPTPPALPARASGHFEYAEEAKRAAQRYFEQVAHIEQVTAERDDWRSRALVAENEVSRLLEREAALLAQIDSKSIAAMKEAEEYKTTLTVIGTQYASAARLLLDGFAALDKAGLRAMMNMPDLAEALKEPDGGSLPRVASEGADPEDGPPWTTNNR